MAVVLQAYRTENGRILLDLVDESPVLLIFLASLWVLVLPPDASTMSPRSAEQ